MARYAGRNGQRPGIMFHPRPPPRPAGMGEVSASGTAPGGPPPGIRRPPFGAEPPPPDCSGSPFPTRGPAPARIPAFAAGLILAGGPSPPRLAAGWVVATRSRRLVEPYGAFRAALHAEDECTPSDEEETEHREPECASCGSRSLTDPARRVTAHVAREAHELARATGKERWSLRAEVDARSGAKIPARVKIRRP